MNLKEATQYEVRVASVGTQGSSLPSTTLVALTYYQYGRSLMIYICIIYHIISGSTDGDRKSVV